MATFDERTFEEFRNLFNNPVDTIQKYLKIDGKYIDLSQRQIDLLHLIRKERFVKEIGERQTGMTTVLMVALMIDVLTTKDKTFVFISHKSHNSKKDAATFRAMMKSLPDWIKPKVTKDNVRSFEFNNGVQVLFKTPTPDEIRGYTVNGMYVDNFQHISREFWDCIYPVVSSGSSNKIVQFQTVED